MENQDWERKAESHIRLFEDAGKPRVGTLRRVVVSLTNAAVNQARAKNPKTKHNARSFQNRFRSAHGGRERLGALIFAELPNVLHL